MFYKLIIFVTPLTMILLYPYYIKIAHSKPNKWSGFRTETSMKSQENWTKANLYAGKWTFRWGCVLMALSIVLILWKEFITERSVLIVTVIQLATVILITIQTENYISKN